MGGRALLTKSPMLAIDSPGVLFAGVEGAVGGREFICDIEFDTIALSSSTLRCRCMTGDADGSGILCILHALQSCVGDPLFRL